MEPAQGLPFQVLEEITDGFSEDRLLGTGAYGKVYKGIHKNGDEVAVKMVNSNYIDDWEFKELRDHMMLDHPNIVRVVAYCDETEHIQVEYNGRHVIADMRHRALCLEYMHNGSLQKHLSDECDGLDWHTRYKIIKGTSEGLQYLHEGYTIPVYHMDLKPDNILLDRNMVPKLADFGLSPFGRGQTIRMSVSSLISRVGTIGYLPPEYIERGRITEKNDIFSLGVVMIKIIAGPGGHTKSAEMSPQEFIDQVQNNWRNRLQSTWSGSLLEAYCQQVKTCTEIALNCLEKDSTERPSIAAIILRLNEMETMIEESKKDSESPLDEKVEDELQREMTVEGDSDGDADKSDEGDRRYLNAGGLCPVNGQTSNLQSDGDLNASGLLQSDGGVLDSDGGAPGISIAVREIPEDVPATKVSVSSVPIESAIGVGSEEKDDGWISVRSRGDRVHCDPAIDLRPIGVRSKFWSLTGDDDSDEEIGQSPFTPDLVRHAAVHGFTRTQLFEAETALQDWSIQRRVQASVSPADADEKVVLARQIIKAWTAGRGLSMAPWSGKLPRPRTSLALTLGDCSTQVLQTRCQRTSWQARRSAAKGTSAEVLRRSSSPLPTRTKPNTAGTRDFQFPFSSDPILAAQNPSQHAGSGEPVATSHQDANEGGPSVENTSRRGRRRSARLPDRFLRENSGIDEHNRKTLAINPAPPSYAQVVNCYYYYRRAQAQQPCIKPNVRVTGEEWAK